jgi:DNA-binding XRE family transcriptional regulator
MVDSERLKEAIKESGLKKVFIAEKLGITYQGYQKKENGKSDFLANEVSIMKDLLHLTNKEVAEIFFP